jgi:galactose mutarotase-like enzyme
VVALRLVPLWIATVSNPTLEWLTLDSDALRAQVDPLGAQLSVLQDSDNRDLLWNGDPSIWAGRAPVLFPIVGALANGVYRLGSKSYPLSRHGFARGRRFEILEASTQRAVLRLSADAESLQLYPFHFELDMHFDLQDSTLTVTSLVRNVGDAPMPASFGYHPAFRWPLPFGRPRTSHFIEFDDEEKSPVRRLDSAGLLTPTLHPTPISGRRLTLDDALFQDDVLIFDHLQSRAVIYGADVGARIKVSFPDAHYLGVWTKPGAQFICIEPWRGIADPQGYSGDFTAKPGVFVVASSAEVRTTLRITLLPP